MSFRDYIFFPDRDPDNQKFYKLQEACDWSAEEFKFTKEREDYLKSPPSIRRLLKKIFGFFLIGDGLISEALVDYIKKAVQEKNWPKVYYLSMQLKIENTHAETYSKAALTIIPEEEHQEIIDMCEESECLKNKGLWLQNNCENHENEGLANVGMAVGEGVFFVSQFSIIFYMRKLNLFHNFIESNEQISKDETLHRDQKCMEAKKYFREHGYNNEEAHKIIMEGVIVEKEFAKDLLCEPIMGEQADKDAGLTIGNLERYIEMLADQICFLVEMPRIYKMEIVLNWMTDINLSQKTNFYERDVVGSYRKFKPVKDVEEEEEDTGKIFGDLNALDF